VTDGITIRPITAEDFDAVAELLAELGRPTLSDESRSAAAAVYRRHVGRSDTASLLAERDGRPIGFCSLEFRDRLNWGMEQAWIPDLIVTADARGLGAGKALLARAFELAAERGCWSVTLESGYQREVAHELYRSSGMSNDGYYFLLRMADPPA
jgi:GNAT superfamily N-acetyltransferase